MRSQVSVSTDSRSDHDFSFARTSFVAASTPASCMFWLCSALDQLPFARSSMAPVHFITASFTLFTAITAAYTDCYYFDGSISPNNTVCSGSSTCCGPTATCESFRLCHNDEDPPDVFVRGPCAVSSWSLSVCPQVCLYGKF